MDYGTLLNELRPIAEIVKRYKKDADLVSGLSTLVDKVARVLHDLGDIETRRSAMLQALDTATTRREAALRDAAVAEGRLQVAEAAFAELQSRVNAFKGL